MSLKRRSLGDAERLDWLRLIRSDNVGPVTFYDLLNQFGSAAAALTALPDVARRGGRRKPLAVATKSAAEAELARVAKAGARLVAWGEPDYPPALAAIPDAPPLLSLKGRAELAARRVIGMVGARNASANGRRFARTLAAQLGEAELSVASGLARGIDAAAHEGSLATGTIAVVAGGVDVVYPEENRALQQRIGEQGLLLAEMPAGVEPQARHFPRRNRIISGVALGVVVIEAAERSGSLITARFAAEQGREVFAVPGSPLDPRSRGTNRLIRDGATMVESAADILGEIHPQTIAPPRQAPPVAPADGAPSPSAASFGDGELAEAQRAVLALLSPTPLPVDELLRQCRIPPALVLTVILELELAGRIERQPGNTLVLLS